MNRYASEILLGFYVYKGRGYTGMKKGSITKAKKNDWKSSWEKSLKRDWQLYLLLIIPIVLVVLFNYAAYPGLRMAFMDYKPALKYAGSKWVGFGTFAKIFKRYRKYE